MPSNIRVFWNRWARYILVAALAHALLAVFFIDWILSPRHNTPDADTPTMVVIQLLPQPAAVTPELPPPAATVPPRSVEKSVRAAASAAADVHEVANAERAADVAQTQTADVVEAPEARNDATRSDTGSKPAIAGVVNPSADAVAIWSSEVLAHLTKFKHYPEPARRQRLEDQVYLRIQVDRQGQVLLDQIVESRGFDALDTEARALVERANPLPAPPAVAADADLSFVVSIDFLLEKSKHRLW